ncbi:MAG: nodulation protein NfeD [Vicinamibacteria bacterium]|nr:nodulation protein NfeD [Vicinamibacteria bacterium]
MRRWFMVAVGLFLGGAQEVRGTQVGLIRIDGAIGPATVSYISRAIDVSGARGDQCLVIELDTPGGLLESTKQITRSFYASRVPTVVFVSPTHASAGSAGAFITMAAEIAVMAPNTTIGAAHPVSLGGGGEVEKTDDVMKKKMEQYTASFIEAIADKRHRNVEWARSAVLESASITAERALELKVIDLIADDLPDLLRKLDGRTASGRILETEGAQLAEIPMTAWERFAQLFLRPEAMFVLMLIVIYGIMGELSTPGAILPGVAGAIAFVLVLYMSAILPVNLAGIALILLATVLFIAHIYAPTHGVLTAGGIVSFFLGALMLFNRAEPGFRLSLSLIVPATVLTALFFIFIVGAGLKAQSLPVRAGRETMLGRVVNARGPINANGGAVFIEGELWRAVSETPIEKDEPVEVVGISGLTLTVKPRKPNGDNHE